MNLFIKFVFFYLKTKSFNQTVSDDKSNDSESDSSSNENHTSTANSDEASKSTSSSVSLKKVYILFSNRFEFVANSIASISTVFGRL